MAIDETLGSANIQVAKPGPAAAKAHATIQDLTFTADATGTGGNAITVAYTTGATAGSEVVTVVSNAISVQIATGVSTATQIKAAVDASSPAAALVDTSITGTGSNAQTAILIGPTLAGTDNTLTFYGDQSTLRTALVGGKACELAAHVLQVAGGIVGVMPVTKSIRGGVSAASKIGTGASTLALSLAPQSSITVTCSTAGALGTAAFTFTLGSGTPSAPVTSAAGWSSTGYLVPGTSTTIVFTAGSYIAGAGTADIYTISTAGVIAHPQGAGPAVPTFASSPVDDYAPHIIVVTAGALGTMQFTYSLDGTAANTSAAVTIPGSGVYAIPGTGIVLTFAGTSVLADAWTFSSAAASFTRTSPQRSPRFKPPTSRRSARLPCSVLSTAWHPPLAGSPHRAPSRRQRSRSTGTASTYAASSAAPRSGRFCRTPAA